MLWMLLGNLDVACTDSSSSIATHGLVDSVKFYLVFNETYV